MEASFVLASASPRRKELLQSLIPEFRVIPSKAREESSFKEPQALVRDLALKKGTWVLKNHPELEGKDWILAADTLVFFQNNPLGKPGDREEAYEMLQTLSGTHHEVITGLTLYLPGENRWISRETVTSVFFHKLTPTKIQKYLNTGEWRDAAGAYKIQERGNSLVHHYLGSYSNVVGLPLSTLYGILVTNNFPIK